MSELHLCKCNKPSNHGFSEDTSLYLFDDVLSSLEPFQHVQAEDLRSAAYELLERGSSAEKALAEVGLRYLEIADGTKRSI
jgi:hypothetical protein